MEHPALGLPDDGLVDLIPLCNELLVGAEGPRPDDRDLEDPLR